MRIDGQIGIVDEFVQPKRRLDWYHLVLATVNYERSVRKSSNILLWGAHRINPSLARSRKHRRERVREFRLNAAFVAHLGELVVHELARIGKYVEYLPHVLERGLESPHALKALGDREGHSHAAHQDQLVDTFGMLDRDPKGKRAAETIPDKTGLLNSKRIHQSNDLIRPRLHSVNDILRPFREAEPDHVRCDDAEFGSQGRHHEASVRVGRESRARTVDQEDGFVTGTILEIIRFDSVCDCSQPDRTSKVRRNSERPGRLHSTASASSRPHISGDKWLRRPPPVRSPLSTRRASGSANPPSAARGNAPC